MKPFKNKTLALLAACLLAPAAMWAQASFYVDFGPYNTQNGNLTTSPDANGHYWNNVHAQGTADAAMAYPQTVQLLAADNTQTDYELVLSSRFTTNGRLNGALLSPDKNLLGDLAVATATEDYIFTEPAQDYVNIIFRKLNPQKSYTFTVFGYRQSAGQRGATFRFDGENSWSEAYNTASTNGQSVLTTDPIWPNRDGVITLTVIKNVVNENGMVHINAMKIVEKDGTRPNQNLTLRQKMLIDFGENNVAGRGDLTTGADQNGNYWNNIYSTDGNWIRTGHTLQLVNAQNQATGIVATVMNDIETNGKNNGGVLSPQADDLFDLAVPTATGDYAFTSQDGEKSIKFSGLDPAMRYRFYIFGSRITSSADHRRCIYRVVGDEGWMMENTTSGLSVGGDGVHGNVRNVQVSDYMRPTATGEIVFSAQKNVGGFAHYNVIKIEEYAGATDTPSDADLTTVRSLLIEGSALPAGETATLQELRPSGLATGNFETYVRLQPGTWTLSGTTADGQTLTIGADAEGALAKDGAAFTVQQEQVVRIKVQLKQKKLTVLPVQLYVKGNIAQAESTIGYVGNGRFEGSVTLDDAKVFLFSDKYIYFAFNDNDQLALRRLTTNRNGVGMTAEGFQTENIRINGGTYTFTVDMQHYTWSATAPIDDEKISAFGSSVCNGQGATNYQGYAYLYGQQLGERFAAGQSDRDFWVSGISIGGNNTQNLLDRFDEMTRNHSRYVIIGLSLGNEGIHESANKQQTLNQFSTNMQTLISQIRAQGKVPVVMNNYTRGDFTAEDYSYIKQMNLIIHQWDVASINTLGAIDDGTGKWATNYMQDNAHPTTAGHQEFFYAMTPSLFDALAAGKAQPVRNMTQAMTLADRATLQFAGEGTVHPFTISLRVKGGQAGNLFSFLFSSGTRQGQVSVNEDGNVVYTNTQGKTLVSTTAINDDAWHTVTLTHYYAQGRTLLYVDKAAAGELRERMAKQTTVTIGDATADVSRQVSELFFWRAALSPEEVAAVVDGKLLRSSLELYVPTAGKDQLENLAMSTNHVDYVTSGTQGPDPQPTLTSPYEGTTVQAGDEFYLYNVETGLWLQENARFTADWNTRGELGPVGFDVQLLPQGSGWQINPKFGHNLSMNGSNWYLDTSAAVTAWTFEPATVEGIANAYYIKYNGQYLHATPAPDCKLTIDALDDQALWQVVTREERMAYARQASASDPRDVSFLIRCNEFTHEDTRRSAWTLTDNDNGGANWTSGRFEPENRQNSVFEAWNMTRMRFQQTVSGLPAGYYEVQAQAAYCPTDAAGMNRADLDAYNDGTLNIYGHLFANDAEATLPTVYTEQYAERTGHYAAKDLGGIWVMDGVNQFSYSVANNPAAFLVTVPVHLEADGDLTLGIRVADAPTKTIWVLADKFRLHYLGTSLADGIEAPAQSATTTPSGTYTLQGVKVNAPLKPGIYLRDGRKIIIR